MINQPHESIKQQGTLSQKIKPKQMTKRWKMSFEIHNKTQMLADQNLNWYSQGALKHLLKDRL